MTVAESRREGAILRWETLTKRQFDEIDREQAIVLLTCSPLEVHGPQSEVDQLKEALSPLGCIFYVTEWGFRSAHPKA